MNQDRLGELAGILARRTSELRQQRGTKPSLQVVAPSVVGFSRSALQRDIVYSRVRDIAKLYDLRWLVRQETVGVDGVMECMADDDLMQLLETMERAREACDEGVALNEIGIIRKTIHGGI